MNSYRRLATLLLLALSLPGLSWARVTLSTIPTSLDVFVGAGQTTVVPVTLRGVYSGSGSNSASYLITPFGNVTSSPSSGTITTNNQQDVVVQVTVDATQLKVAGSPYSAELDIFSDSDHQQQFLRVLITIYVNGVDISVSPNTQQVTLDQGQQRGLDSTIVSTGQASAAFSSNAAWLKPDLSGAVINSSFTMHMTVDTSKLSPGSYTGTVLISRSGGNSPFASQTVQVSLTVTQPFVLTADRTTVSLNVAQGGPSSSTTVKITATGPGSSGLIASPTLNTPWLTSTALSSSISGGQTADVQITATPGSLTPGTYQGTVTIQGGNSNGSIYIPITVNLTVTASGSPIITSVQTVGGFTDIAPNGWTQIKGVSLAPSSVPQAGMVWDQAPDFQQGKMPTQLGGVSVTIDGKNAFIFYVSAAQINVLAPLTIRTGTVSVIVSAGGVSSPPFAVTVKAAAPSMPNYGISTDIIATHGDYSRVGPAALSVPGFPFTPASRGETIVIYAFGFGLPTETLVNGSKDQFGHLPESPQFKIAGKTATVLFYGVVSPGLYQFNVIVPSDAPTGSVAFTCTYQTVACGNDGNLIAIQ